MFLQYGVNDKTEILTESHTDLRGVNRILYGRSSVLRPSAV